MNTFESNNNSSRRGMSFWMTETFCECRASGELSQKVLGLEDLR